MRRTSNGACSIGRSASDERVAQARGQSKPLQRNLFFGGALGLMIRRHQPPSRTPASHGGERWLSAAAKSLPNRHVFVIGL
jgi:hypothetical protein